MLVDVDDSDDEAPCLIPAGDEVPILVSGSEDDTPNIPVTIITGQYWTLVNWGVLLASCRGLSNSFKLLRS